MNNDHYELTRAAYLASKDYHAAGKRYHDVVSNDRRTDQELMALIEGCLRSGDLYRAALERLLSRLEEGEARDEQFADRMKQFMFRLDAELDDFNEIRSKKQIP